MVRVDLEVPNPATDQLVLTFTNEGPDVAVLDRRRACLAGWVPMGVLQISQPRSWVGLRACSLTQGEEARVRLAPGEQVRATVVLGEWLDRRGGRPLKVRYAASHHDPDTGVVLELASNAVEVRL